MIKEAINSIVNGENLDRSEMMDAMGEIMDGKATQSQIASFITALRMKGETVEEVSGAAQIMRQKATRIDARAPVIVDTCGTGGDGMNTFNISTTAAFVVASAGITVAKHGNRAVSSGCGSADVLEAMGVLINSPLPLMQQALAQTGIGFLYAPLYHPALAQVAQIRKELGVRTMFNILGPLCNPASASHQLLGVYSRDLTEVMAKVLRRLSAKKAFIVYGSDLGDEISLTGTTFVSYLCGRRVTNFRLRPCDFGLKKIHLKDIMVKDVQMSAKVIQEIFAGIKGAPRDIVLANASACFYIAGKTRTFRDGVSLAVRLIDEGRVADKFRQFREFLAHNA